MVRRQVEELRRAGKPAPPTRSTRTATSGQATSRRATPRTATSRTVSSRSTTTRTAATRTATSRTAAGTRAARPSGSRSTGSARPASAARATPSGRATPHSRNRRPAPAAKARRRAPVRRAVPKADTRRRLLVLLAGLLSIFGLIVWKVADLQVINPGHYLAVVTSQTVHTQTLAADRGSIYDRNHNELALTVPGKTVFADPKLITDVAGDALKLSPLLGIPVADLIPKLSAHNQFDYLARKIAPTVADKIAALKLPGIDFLDEPTVQMPDGATTSALLGSVDIDNKGLGGLEAQYDKLLTGTPGELTLAENPQGRTIPVGEHQLVPARPGQDLQLSIDRSMQYQTELILQEQVQAAGAKGGIAIVSSTATGDILAMANVTQDPTTKQVGPSTNNAALTTVYEPGSVMKIATISAAIEKGLITPDTKLVVPDSYSVAGTSFSDAEAHGTETMPVSQIVAQSSNIGTIEIAQKLGQQGVYDAVTGLGYGHTSGLGFPSEAAGTVIAPSTWSGTSIATIPIGQGVSATPLQVLEAYNTVANGGVYVPPRLLDATIDAQGQRHALPAAKTRRVMSTATADEMNQMLRGVVTGGTGTLAAVDGYSVFGKTGTAREPQPNGGYTDKLGRYHYDATFVGVVPAQNPSLSVIVVIDDPAGANYYGGSVAAPAFSKIASYGLRLFGVPPPSVDVAAGGVAVAGAPDGGVDGTVTTEPGHKVRAAATAATVVAAVTPPAGGAPSTAAGTTGAAGHATGPPATGPPGTGSPTTTAP
jgi:cell division protein FtsI (penicillin-binding protein 3)